MPGKSIRTIDRESIGVRTEMARLMREGLTESDALLRVLPDSSNRRRAFNLWISKGLWPLDDIEADTSGISSTTRGETPPKPHRQPITANHTTSTPPNTNSTTGLYEVRYVGPKITTSIKIPAHLQEKALRKARIEDYDNTRGNMSGLVEYLLEDYVNAP